MTSGGSKGEGAQGTQQNNSGFHEFVVNLADL